MICKLMWRRVSGEAELHGSLNPAEPSLCLVGAFERGASVGESWDQQKGTLRRDKRGVHEAIVCQEPPIRVNLPSSPMGWLARGTKKAFLQ